MFTRSLIDNNNYPRVIIYINIRLIKLYFSLRKDILNYHDINLISSFNCSTLCFIINIYLDDQQIALKYLKNTKVNLNNILIITKDFNIRDNDWNLPYPYSHHSTHTGTLWEVADSFNLNYQHLSIKWWTSIQQVEQFVASTSSIL